MKNNIEHDELDLQITSAFCNIAFNISVNDYALECVVLNRLQIGEQLDIDKVFRELGIEKALKYISFTALEGNFIDAKGKIKKLPQDQYRKLFFLRNMNVLYSAATKTQRTNYDFITPYQIYEQILDCNITLDFFDLSPDDEILLRNRAARTFLAAIKLKGLQQGKCVDRYIKKIPYLNEQLKRLIKEHKGHYLLANSDTESINYMLAVLSYFTFTSPQNAKLFKLKIEQWERLQFKNKISY